MPQTAEEAALGQKLGAEVARQLALDLRNMGLPGVQAAGQPPAQPGDLVVKGFFYGVNQGSAAKRVLLGFGSGAADLRTAVEVYEMTPDGPAQPGRRHHRLRQRQDTGDGGAAGRVRRDREPDRPGRRRRASRRTGELSGRTTIEGDAKRTADEIAARFKQGAERQGWI